MVRYKCCCFSARSVLGGAKIGHGGPHCQQSSSGRKATVRNRLHSSDLEAREKMVPFQSQIFDAFLRLFGLSHFSSTGQ